MTVLLHKFLASLTLGFLFCISLTTAASAATGDTCGTGRWLVRVTADADTSKMDLKLVDAVDTTIADLDRMPKVEVTDATPRLPIEMKLYSIDPVVVAYRITGDSTVQLLLKDYNTDSMIIGELPNYLCPSVQATDRWRLIGTGRFWTQGHIGQWTTEWQYLPTTTTTRLHIRTGIAYIPNPTTLGAANGLILSPIITMDTTHIDAEGVTDIPAKAVSVSLYPNPAHDNIQLQLEGITSPIAVTISNVLGETLRTMRASRSLEISVRDLQDGVYFLRVGTNTPKTIRFIVRR